MFSAIAVNDEGKNEAQLILHRQWGAGPPTIWPLDSIASTTASILNVLPRNPQRCRPWRSRRDLGEALHHSGLTERGGNW